MQKDHVRQAEQVIQRIRDLAQLGTDGVSPLVACFEIRSEAHNLLDFIQRQREICSKENKHAQACEE